MHISCKTLRSLPLNTASDIFAACIPLRMRVSATAATAQPAIEGNMHEIAAASQEPTRGKHHPQQSRLVTHNQRTGEDAALGGLPVLARPVLLVREREEKVPQPAHGPQVHDRRHEQLHAVGRCAAARRG